MENEITAHRARAPSRELSVDAGRAGHDRPGDLRRRRRTTVDASAGRSARSVSRENDEPLAATASRVDHWILLEYRGLWGHDALDGSGLSDQVKAHLREQRRAAPARAAPLRPAPRAPAPARARRLRRALDAERGASALPRSSSRRHDDLLGLDLAGAGGGEPVDAPALPRLHARQARPLLRALRAAALRGAARAGRARLGLAVHARRRRPLRRQPRLPPGRRSTTAGSSREDAWPVLDEHLRRAGRARAATAAARATPSRSRRPSARCARQTGLLGIDDLALRLRSSGDDAWRVALPRPATAVYEVDVVASRTGELDATSPAARTSARRAAALRRQPARSAGSPRARAAGRARAGPRRRARPGRSAARNGSSAATQATRARRERAPGSAAPCPRSEPSAVVAVRGRRSPSRAARAASRRSSSLERAQLRELAVEDRPPRCRRTRRAPAPRDRPRASSCARSRSSELVRASTVRADAARKLDVLLAASSSAARSASSHVSTLTPTVRCSESVVRRQRLVQPAARQVERVAGAQRRRRAPARRARPSAGE